MSWGGGIWTTQNKKLPGAYINFISASRARSVLSDRGHCAMALELNWGPDEQIFEITAEDFQNRSLELLGYAYADDAIQNLRELFRGTRVAYLYRLNGGGIKASNAFAEALYSGERGNDLRIVIDPNADDAAKFDVSTYLDTIRVDTQTVADAKDLVPNVYVTFKEDAVLGATAGIPLTGGTNAEPTNAAHQEFLTEAESYAFNTLGCISTEDTVKALYTAFTRRMRDDNGVKFQTVLHRYAADYEGVISVENNSTPELVYWVAGMQAGCAVNASLQNTVYDGEYTVDVDLTVRELEVGMQTGKFMFHRAYREARVLQDINTLVTHTERKNREFSFNQTIRVLDQIGNDIALMFNTRYLGKMPSNDSGRVSLWGDIVAYLRELVTLEAIEPIDPDQITVAHGDDKRAVLVTGSIAVINAMEQLYMALYVS